MTPALLRRLQGEGISDKELSALLARDQLVPIGYETTRPKLSAKSALCSGSANWPEHSQKIRMSDVAAKLAELVAPS